MSIRRRRFNRKHPAPPPTPEGMVYVTLIGGGTRLVPMEELEAACRRSMAEFENLSSLDRENYHRAAEGLPPVNPALAKLGIGRMNRP